MTGIVLRKYLLTHHPALFVGQSSDVMRQHAAGLEDLLERRVLAPVGVARDACGAVRLDLGSELREKVDSSLEHWASSGDNAARWLRPLWLTSLQSYLHKRHPSAYDGARSWQEQRARTRNVAYASGLLAHKTQDFILYISENDQASMGRIAGSIGSPARNGNDALVLASEYLRDSDIFPINSLTTRKQKIRELLLELEAEGVLRRSGRVDKRYPRTGRARYVTPNDPEALRVFNEALARRGLAPSKSATRQAGLRPLRSYLMEKYPHLYEDRTPLTQLNNYSGLISVLEDRYRVPLQRVERLRYIIRDDKNVETAIHNAIADLQLDEYFRKAKIPSPESTLQAREYVRTKYGSLLKEFERSTRERKVFQLLHTLEEKGLVHNSTAPRYIRTLPEDQRAIDDVVQSLRLQGFFSRKKMALPLREHVLACLPYLKDHPADAAALENEIAARAGHVLVSRNGAWYVKSKDALKYVKNLLV